MVAAHNVFAQRKTLWNWKAGCIEYRQRRCSNVGCCTSQCEKEMRYEMLIDHIKRCRAEMKLETLALALALSLFSSFHHLPFYPQCARSIDFRSLYGFQLQLLKRHLNHNKAFRFIDAEKQLDVHVLAIAWIMISGSVPGIHSTGYYFVYVRRKTDKH